MKKKMPFFDQAGEFREAKGSFLKRLSKRLAIAFGYFLFATLMFKIFGFKELTTEGRGLQMAGAVLGGFLALNLNIGYGKWESARSLLGGIKSSCVGLALLSQNTYMGRKWKRDYLNTVACFPEIIISIVTGDGSREKYLELLPEKSAVELDEAEDKAVWLSLRLGLLLNQAIYEQKNSGDQKFIDDFYSASESYKDEMLKTAGGVWGVIKFPSPRAIRQLSEVFVLIYIFFMPWTVADQFGWLAPLVCLAVAAALFTLDLAGKDLIHPFERDSLAAIPIDKYAADVKKELLKIGEVNFSSFPS